MSFVRLTSPRFQALVALTALGLNAPTAQASVADTFGLGSRSAALGGATVAGGYEGYVAWNNPAGLPLRSGPRLRLSYGLVFAHPEFKNITGIVLRNDTYTSDRLESGTVAEDYRNTFGQSFGLALRLAPEFHDLTAGLVAYFPLNQVAYLDTGETFIPEYVMYRARTQRPTFDFAVGGTLGSRWSVGIGTHIGFAVTGNANLFLQTDTSSPPATDRSSTARLATSIKPKAAPYFALLYRTNTDRIVDTQDAPIPRAGDATAGLVIRMPVESKMRISATSAAAVFGGSPGININFVSDSVAYYDPLSFELGGTYRLLSDLTAYFQADYQVWSGFQEPALRISDSECTSAGCGIEILPTRNPVVEYQNVLTPRVGVEWDAGRTTWRAGANHRRSIRKGIPTGAGNTLDPARTTLAFGAGRRLERFLGFETSYQVDFHASLAFLHSQSITKTAGDEAGDSGQKVGSPGYTAGGIIPGLGVSLSLVF